MAKKINTAVNHLGELKLDQIINTVCDFMAVRFEDLDSCSQERRLSLCRSTIAYFAHYYCGYLIVDLAALFLREPHTVSRLIHGVIARAQKDQSIQEHLKRVERQLVLLKTTS